MPGGNGYQNASLPRPARRQTDNALSGAVIAFAKSQPLKSDSTIKDSQARAAASAAGSKQLSRTATPLRSPRRTPSPLGAQPALSNAQDDNRTAIGRDTGSVLLTPVANFRFNTSANLAPPPKQDSAFSRSPSNTAQEYARPRYGPSHAAASAAATKTAQIVQPVSPLSHGDPNLPFEDDQDILPAPGTVEEVKKWLQSLNEGGDIKRSYTIESAGLSRSQTLRASRESNNYDPLAGHALKSDESDNSRPGSRARSLTIGPEIVSPRPVRPPTKLSDRKLDEATLPLSIQLQGDDFPTAQLGITSNDEFPEITFRRSVASPVLFSETDTQPESIDCDRRERGSSLVDRTGNEVDLKIEPTHSAGTISASLPQRSISATLEMPSISLVPPTSITHQRSQTSRPSQSLPRPRRYTSSTNQDVPLTKDNIGRIESLANAIVASHLASSRAPSPTKLGSTFPVRRQAEKRYKPFQQFKKHKQDSRTPSPSKGVQYTMRKETDSTDDEAPNPHKRRRRRFFNKHPNKHHEGDRKRWRDMITEQERKRYEGVWAANRGIHLTYTTSELEISSLMNNANQSVSNLVVRDIWSRSRLPHHVLEEAWELVDQQGIGRLSREEFVVGLWLVDQRLKGRKLPHKVGDSVWRSVRGIYGLKPPKR